AGRRPARARGHPLPGDPGVRRPRAGGGADLPAGLRRPAVGPARRRRGAARVSCSGRPGDERRVALLRGVNLAARRRVSMADLRELVAGLGYGDVATLLQSGNVVLSSDEPPTRVAERIAGAIAERLGMDVDVIVRTRS